MKIKLSIKHKVAAIFAVVGLILVLGIAGLLYAINYQGVAAYYADIAFRSSHIAAALVDGDKINSYLTDGPDESYVYSEDLLRELKILNNLTFLYVLAPDAEQDDLLYVFDIFSEGNDPSHIYTLGERAGESEIEYDVVMGIYESGEAIYQVSVTKSEYGYLATAPVPVLDGMGNVTAVACADISMDAVIADIRFQTVVIAGIVLVIMVLALIAILLIINKKVLKPVIALSKHMSDFSAEEGNLEHFDFKASGDEIQAMAENYNAMVGDIKTYIENLAATTAEKERIGTELGVATRIQKSLLPCIFPAFPDRAEFDIHASMFPAKEVGGDFYDFFLVDEHTLAVVVADVSGKGVPAALFMVIAKTLIKNNAQKAAPGPGKSPGEVFATVNEMLRENNAERMFVTAFMAYIDLKSGAINCVNAGHNPPLIGRADGSHEYLRVKPAIILACFVGRTYDEYETTLAEGDSFFLYTDGVTEAMNEAEELFGEDRLLAALNRYGELPPEGLLHVIKDEIDSFAGAMEQADDITMLALRYKGENP